MERNQLHLATDEVLSVVLSHELHELEDLSKTRQEDEHTLWALWIVIEGVPLSDDVTNQDASRAHGPFLDLWLLHARALSGLMEQLLVLTGQVQSTLLLEVVDQLVQVVLTNFKHARIDLDDLALVVLFLDGHLHHVGCLSLHPFILFSARITILLLCKQVLSRVPSTRLARAPLALLLALAIDLLLFVKLFSALVGFKVLNGGDARFGKVIGEEVRIESGAHKHQFELEPILLTSAKQMLDHNQ